MSRCRLVKGSLTILAVAAIIASCGGSDNDAAPASTAGVEPTASNADDATIDDTVSDDAVSDDAATDDRSDDESDDESDVESDVESGDESGDDSDGGSTVNCDAIFSMAEMEEFLAEPVELTEEANDNVGQLTCTWESIEDNDLEDLGVQALQVQFYSGSPIAGSAFFDPELYEDPTPIADVGDLAYAASIMGTDFYFFVDDPVAGSLGYITFDMSAESSLPMRTPEDIEQLFRLFHDRVT